MISSRKEENVSSATLKLHSLGLRDVAGVVCHVGKAQDRSALVSEVMNRVSSLLSSASTSDSCACYRL